MTQGEEQEEVQPCSGARLGGWSAVRYRRREARKRQRDSRKEEGEVERRDSTAVLVAGLEGRGGRARGKRTARGVGVVVG